jgi:hypothetical protein
LVKASTFSTFIDSPAAYVCPRSFPAGRGNARLLYIRRSGN